MFNDLNITDMETCYKAFRAEVIKAITIEENRFGIEPELTAKVAKMRLRIYEVPVSYHGRTYDEGKKIGWKDGVRALYCIVKYGVRRGKPPVTAAARTTERLLLQPAERAAPDGGGAQLLLDAQQAVVLRDALRARERAGLDLARAHRPPPGRR